MATRKALVLVGGEIQQLQTGDTLAGPISEQELQSMTNADAAAVVLGEVVYSFGSDSVKKAKADAIGTAEAIALGADASIAAAGVGNFMLSGLLTGLSGLTPGATYYLSAATAGAMTTTAPSATGQVVTRLGKATSATEFLFRPERAILL